MRFPRSKVETQDIVKGEPFAAPGWLGHHKDLPSCRGEDKGSVFIMMESVHDLESNYRRPPVCLLSPESDGLISSPHPQPQDWSRQTSGLPTCCLRRKMAKEKKWRQKLKAQKYRKGEILAETREHS